MRNFIWLALASMALMAPSQAMAFADDEAVKERATASRESAEDSKQKAEKPKEDKKGKEDSAEDSKAKDREKASKTPEKGSATADDDKKEKDAKADKDAKETKSDADEKESKAAKRTTKKVRLAHIELEGALPESSGEATLFGDLGFDLRKTLIRLDKAAEDKAVAGVVLKIEAVPGFGKVNELRSAIKRVRAKGKKVYAVLESAYGQQYLVAAACDEIVMPESGDLIIPGIRAEFAFYKDLLAKLGIEADMMHVGDYKGAAEPYTRESLSEPVRKNMTALVDDLYDDMLSTIAADRDIKIEDVRELVNRGIISTQAAKDAGLIDRVAYPDQLRERLAGEYNTDRLVYILNYGKKSLDADLAGPMGMMKMFQTMFGGEKEKSDSKGSEVAIVYAVGPIMTGESTNDLFAGSVMGSTTIVEALRSAAKDDDVKAIVLRVDSPGGSALASDLIWRQTQVIEKPIVVSMGDVAASGGYYISMGADRIFAEPGTVTGSIGVVGGKLAMKGLYDKIGMDTEVISRGENSGLFSTTEKFSQSEREVFETMMKDVYKQFTKKAAKGRDMPLDELEKLAGGQVFSGRDAKRNGLIDDIGTLQDAVNAAKRLAGLDADEKVELKILPEPKNPFEALFGADMDAPREDEARLMAGLASFVPELRGALRHAAQLRYVMREPVALMMPYWFEIK